jgi:hypothetical protein
VRNPVIATLATIALPLFTQAVQMPFSPAIPKVWDDDAMREIELPRAAGIAVHQVPSDFYYQIPVRSIFKMYPIYGPGKEPPGYWESLLQKDPEPAFDRANLRTEEDWIKAGESVFESANLALAVGHPFADVRNPEWYAYTGVQLDARGMLPYYRYVIRKKGSVEVTFDSCASCHTRLMPDGFAIKGGPGNLPFGRIWAYQIMHDKRIDPASPSGLLNRIFWAAPWIQPDPTAPLSTKTAAELAEHVSTLPPGVNPRQGTSGMYPVQTPDLIGVKDRRYLDHTGLHEHRSIADLMRYDAINNFIQEITDYDGFRPMTGDSQLPKVQSLSRDSDENLYALALYLYSLTPPANPNRADAVAEAGQKIFVREGCAACHAPPLYTNNMLTPAVGFTVPDQDRRKYRILNTVVGTDPFLATKTRRGTGYYKIPSLKGVWYRGPFEHNGSVATLEDWFDASRLRDDYVPTGYRGYDMPARAVRGHEFGLKLRPDEKKALIAFLKRL